jgi:hypothetical protein
VRFEWNALKAAGNLRKHDVSFHEAVTVFFDPLSATGDDPDHSGDERRLVTFVVLRASAGGRTHGAKRRDSNHHCPGGDAVREEAI